MLQAGTILDSLYKVWLRVEQVAELVQKAQHRLNMGGFFAPSSAVETACLKHIIRVQHVRYRIVAMGCQAWDFATCNTV